MWLLILFTVLLAIGPSRQLVISHWKICIPMMAGAVAGWELGEIAFGDYPTLSSWVPAAWAVILGVLSAKTFSSWWG